MKNLVALFCFLASLNLYSQTASLDSLKYWMNWLSADERKGRVNGSIENVEVADWLTAKFRSLGAIPVPGHYGMFQDYKTTQGKTLTNIIAFIPGRSDSGIIILSAHYDHIGMNELNSDDKIFNGADDNASGVCMLLGVAQRIQAESIKPWCSIVLAAFSGEEIGIQGSSSFCQSDLVPWEKVRLNLNFEMCGRSDEQGKNNFYITGPAHSSLAAQINEYNSGKDWQLKDVGPMVNLLYEYSDNYSFIKYRNSRKKCLPAHTMATSLGMSYIHQVADEASFIDFENLNSLITHTAGLLYFLSEKDITITCND
jgi:hypothetical protein